MSEMQELLNDLRNVQLEDEDGNPVLLTMRQGLSEHDLQRFQERVRFPVELRELLAVCNGMNLFGVNIMPAEGQEYFSDPGMVSFHNWGDGNFDCIAVCSSEFAEGTILFMNHSPDAVVPIDTSLKSWILKVVAEIKEKGALLHPADYEIRKERGLYGHVLESLRGQDCELNRQR